MGLTNESQGGGNWLSVIKGEISKKVPQGTEGAVERTNKNGVVVYEMKYNALEGTLKRIGVFEGEYGDQWIFVIDDGTEEYNLALPYSSGTANGFLYRLPNTDLKSPLKIKTFYIEGEDGISRQFLGVYQGGGKVEPLYTKEEPNGLPPMVKVKRKGKEEWDDSDRLLFLQKLVDDEINPQLADLYPVDHVETEEAVPVEEEQPPPHEESDLPF